jgi:hypothetical protein
MGEIMRRDEPPKQCITAPDFGTREIKNKNRKKKIYFRICYRESEELDLFVTYSRVCTRSLKLSGSSDDVRHL